jgi:hypothetical protein
MKDNSKPNLIPLLFIIAGSLLLALPGIYGAWFLFMFAGEGVGKNPLMLLLPLPPVVGFALLFGYFWTIATKRFVGWLWCVSFLFNLIITIICFAGFFLYLTDIPDVDKGARLLILFPLWTTFVTVASGYYLRLSRAANKVPLP